jgi:hypothetical protein
MTVDQTNDLVGAGIGLCENLNAGRDQHLASGELAVHDPAFLRQQLGALAIASESERTAAEIDEDPHLRNAAWKNAVITSTPSP